MMLPPIERLKDFYYYTVSGATAEKMAALREKYFLLACAVADLPDCRERSLALTQLEESSMRAIQCLAVAEGTPVEIGAIVR
jgi:hypothetical protein